MMMKRLFVLIIIEMEDLPLEMTSFRGFEDDILRF